MPKLVRLRAISVDTNTVGPGHSVPFFHDRSGDAEAVTEFNESRALEWVMGHDYAALMCECTPSYADSFLRRVDEAAGRPGQPVVAFLLCKYAEDAAFKKLSEAGVLVWTHSRLFGPKVAEALAKSIELVEQLARQQAVSPLLFQEAFEGLENFSSLFGDLKGDLFEVLIGYFYQSIGYDCRLAWQVESDAGKAYDIDVQATLGPQFVVVECKGYRANATVGPHEVNEHFMGRFPVARDTAKQNTTKNYKTFKAVFVTSATFDPETESRLGAKGFGNKDDSDFELVNGEALQTKLREAGLKELADLVTRYF